MVCFDATVLIDLFNPRIKGPRKARIDLLVADLEQRRQKVVVPAPAYAEFLIGAADARQAYHARVEASSIFRVEPFGKRASLECAILLGQVFTAKQQKDVTKTKIKFDWMIVAIAKAATAECVYTSDPDIVRCCKHVNLPCISIDSITLPPPPPQRDWIEGADSLGAEAA